MPVEYDVIEQRFADELEVAVYYVASEALTNAAKHAEATHVRVRVAVEDGDARARGRRRRPRRRAPGEGSGLVGLNDRVEALRGRLRVTSPRRRGHDRARRVPAALTGKTCASVEDFVENITRGNPGSVKTVLASVVLALAAYQLILAAIGYRKLPVIDAKPAFFTHRASGDVIAVLLVLVALMCLAVFGFEDDYVLHSAAGSARVAVLAIKIAVVRSGIGGRFLPYLGVTLFALLALTWFTVTPDFLAGED